MSANHVPMHYGTGCGRCARRKARLSAYVGRMAHRAGAAGQKALLKVELGRMRRSHAYQVRPAASSHRHEPGRRQRMAVQKRRGAFQRAEAGLIAHLKTRPARGARVKRAYCAALGHKWSGPRWPADGKAMRVCERGSCQATELIKVKKPADKAA